MVSRLKWRTRALVSLGIIGGSLLTFAACTDFDCVYSATCLAATASVDGSAGAIVDATTDDDADVDAGPVALNPYGVPYPVANLGWRVRNTIEPGLVIPNVRFERGIRPRTREAEPPTIAPLELKDLFDPQTRAHDVIILVLSAAGEAPTRAFFDGIPTPPNRTVMLSALGYGYAQNVAPSLQHFTDWFNEHPYMHHVMDSKFEQLGRFFANAKPVIVLIDARTMEIAYRVEGAASRAVVESTIAEIRGRQPAY